MTVPVYTSRPAFFLPFSCCDLSSTSISIGSSPAFSASVRGMTSSASANLLAANCSLPFNVAAYSLSRRDSSTSGLPPPATNFSSSITTPTTRSASSRARSKLSTTCSVPPRITKLTAFGLSQPVMYSILSTPIFFSSARSAIPISDSDISSTLEITAAPHARDNFSISLFLTRLIASIPAFDK